MQAGQGLRPWTPDEADAVRERLALHLIAMQAGATSRTAPDKLPG
jgi:hypothetical protein